MFKLLINKLKKMQIVLNNLEFCHYHLKLNRNIISRIRNNSYQQIFLHIQNPYGYKIFLKTTKKQMATQVFLFRRIQSLDERK